MLSKVPPNPLSDCGSVVHNAWCGSVTSKHQICWAVAELRLMGTSLWAACRHPLSVQQREQAPIGWEHPMCGQQHVDRCACCLLGVLLVEIHGSCYQGTLVSCWRLKTIAVNTLYEKAYSSASVSEWTPDRVFDKYVCRAVEKQWMQTAVVNIQLVFSSMYCLV